MELLEEMEYSIHPPSPFIARSWQALLPGWSTPVLSVLVLLQRSPVMLCQHSSAAEAMKQHLRDRSIQLIVPLTEQLRVRNHNAMLFDPRTGLPYTANSDPSASDSDRSRSSLDFSGLDNSSSGIPLNDVAVVHALLGYTCHQYGRCHCIVHPFWGSGVYPTIMLASTTPDVLKTLTSVVLDAL